MSRNICEDIVAAVTKKTKRFKNFCLCQVGYSVVERLAFYLGCLDFRKITVMVIINRIVEKIMPLLLVFKLK